MLTWAHPCWPAAEMARAGRVKFSALFAAATSRTEVVVTFLAMLELIRLRQIIALQEAAFGEIEIAPAPVPAPSVGAGTSVPAEPEPAAVSNAQDSALSALSST